jgi:hypothetical protein
VVSTGHPLAGVSYARECQTITVSKPGKIGGQPKLTVQRLKATSKSGLSVGLPPCGPHVRFRQVQTLVREGSLLVKLRNSA